MTLRLAAVASLALLAVGGAALWSATGRAIDRAIDSLIAPKA